MFYVLEGMLTFRIGADTAEGPPDVRLRAARRPAHLPNPSLEPARFLNFNIPGGFETYMRELAAAWNENGGSPDPTTIGELA
jgi:hypothetical protein